MTGPAALPPAGVPPEEAIAFFRAKGFRIGFSWLDIFRAEHVRAFTVAKAMTRDVLEDIRAAVDAAIADGTTLAEFRSTLRPKLEAKGWWGRKTMIDPLTAQAKTVQLGSPRRLKIIFDTNLRTAYQAGKWERIERTKAAFPYLEYSSVMDGRERPEHHAWDGTILPVDDPWWDTHYGPCDWNCRCSATPRSQRMLDRKGLKVSTAPVAFPREPWTNERTGETGTLERGIGRGWDCNVGKEYLRGLSPRPLPESFSPPDDAGDEAGEIGASAALSSARMQIVDRFLKAFAVAAGGEAIWEDQGGWPLAIGRGWFVGGDGSVRLPRGAAGIAIDRIAAAIVTADAIRWVWVRGRDGRALLMRRYSRTVAGMTTQVDVGGVGWRWRTGPAAEIAAGYNPHQPRHGAGGPQGGRFRSTHGAAMRASLNGDRKPVRKALIGVVDAPVSEQTARIGIDTAGRKVTLSHSLSIHILNKHGVGREQDGRQKPVTVNDLFKAAKLLNQSSDITRPQGKRLARGGQVKFEARTVLKSLTYHMVFEVNARDVTLVTMFKRK